MKKLLSVLIILPFILITSCKKNQFDPDCFIGYFNFFADNSQVYLIINSKLNVTYKMYNKSYMNDYCDLAGEGSFNINVVDFYSSDDKFEVRFTNVNYTSYCSYNLMPKLFENNSINKISCGGYSFSTNFIKFYLSNGTNLFMHKSKQYDMKYH